MRTRKFDFFGCEKSLSENTLHRVKISGSDCLPALLSILHQVRIRHSWNVKRLPDLLRIVLRGIYEKNCFGNPYRRGAWIGGQLCAALYGRHLIVIGESLDCDDLWRAFRGILRFRWKRSVTRYYFRRRQRSVQFFRNVHGGRFREAVRVITIFG